MLDAETVELGLVAYVVDGGYHVGVVFVAVLNPVVGVCLPHPRRDHHWFRTIFATVRFDVTTDRTAADSMTGNAA